MHTFNKGSSPCGFKCFLTSIHSLSAPTVLQQASCCGTTGQTQWTKPSSSSAPAATPSASLSAAASTAPFIAADAFSGPRQGYVYKQGSQGTGYYKDTGPMAVQGGLFVKQALPEGAAFLFRAFCAVRGSSEHSTWVQLDNVSVRPCCP